MPVEYQIIRTTHQLEALAPEWTQLYLQDPFATPFQTPEWLIPWWHQFGQKELLGLTIRHSGSLIGFIPFYIYERKLLLVGVGTSDYLGGVFAPACDVEHVRAAIELLHKEQGWDEAYPSQIVRGSLLYQAFSARFETESCSRMPAALIGDLPVKIRRNAMYYRNRAMRLGALELEIANSANWGHVFHALRSLHTSRWERHGEPGVLVDERVLAWHTEALPLLASSGLLRLCSLKLNGETIGVLYSLIDPPGRLRRTQYFYITAYSVEHADLRPGTVMLALAIDCARNDGVEFIDMLRGDEPYKKIWHLVSEPTYGFNLKR